MSDVLSAEARHNERLEQELISQGRCPYCGWRTVVSGRGQVCGSCVRDAVATRLAAARAGGCAADLAEALRDIERTGHRVTDWAQGGDGVTHSLNCSGCIARDALLAYDRAVSGQTAEKEEA